MKGKHRLVEFSINHPRWIVALMVALAVALGALIPAVKVDTDPENMLSEDEAVRVFHDRMKKLFDLNDMVVVGIVNETHEHGVFNPESLRKVYELTRFAVDELDFPAEQAAARSVPELLAERYGAGWRRLWRKERPGAEREPAVVDRNVIAPSEVDYVEPGERAAPGRPGTIRLEWLMRKPPETEAAAHAVRDKIVTDLDAAEPYVVNPLYYGTMVS